MAIAFSAYLKSRLGQDTDMAGPDVFWRCGEANPVVFPWGNVLETAAPVTLERAGASLREQISGA
jgi:hypothetical protein